MFYMRLKICCVGILFLVPCITPRLSRIIQPGQFRANSQTRSSRAKAVNVAVESTPVVNVIANQNDVITLVPARSPPHVGGAIIIAAAAISIPYSRVRTRVLGYSSYKRRVCRRRHHHDAGDAEWHVTAAAAAGAIGSTPAVSIRHGTHAAGGCRS